MRETLREMIYLIQISSIWFFNKVEAHKDFLHWLIGKVNKRVFGGVNPAEEEW